LKVTAPPLVDLVPSDQNAGAAVHSQCATGHAECIISARTDVDAAAGSKCSAGLIVGFAGGLAQNINAAARAALENGRN
jgi:hypothetical protein